jgi:uncharacterized membrane protein
MKAQFRFIGETKMNTTRIIAILLIAAGVLALVYGGFSYTKDTTAVKLGPIELSVKEKETVNVPVWAGVGAIVIGGLLLVFGSRKG